jgi:hypothetical protein
MLRPSRSLRESQQRDGSFVSGIYGTSEGRGGGGGDDDDDDAEGRAMVDDRGSLR